MTSTELPPCVCGGTAVAGYSPGGLTKMRHFVHCIVCGADSGEYPTPEDADAAWRLLAGGRASGDRRPTGDAVIDPESKAFATLDVISSITGVLVTERRIEAVYEVLGWMTGETLFTHQLPRVGKEAAAAMLRRSPDLASLFEEAKEVTPENWRQWAGRWLAKYGPTLNVFRFTFDEHEYKDPLSEAAEIFPPGRRIVVEI